MAFKRSCQLGGLRLRPRDDHCQGRQSGDTNGHVKCSGRVHVPQYKRAEDVGYKNCREAAADGPSGRRTSVGNEGTGTHPSRVEGHEEGRHERGRHAETPPTPTSHVETEAHSSAFAPATAMTIPKPRSEKRSRPSQRKCLQGRQRPRRHRIGMARQEGARPRPPRPEAPW